MSEESRNRRGTGRLFVGAALVAGALLLTFLLSPFAVPVDLDLGGHGISLRTQRTPDAVVTFASPPYPPHGFNTHPWLAAELLADGTQRAVPGRVWSVRLGPWFYLIRAW